MADEQTNAGAENEKKVSETQEALDALKNTLSKESGSEARVKTYEKTKTELSELRDSVEEGTEKLSEQQLSDFKDQLNILMPDDQENEQIAEQIRLAQKENLEAKGPEGNKKEIEIRLLVLQIIQAAQQKKIPTAAPVTPDNDKVEFSKAATLPALNTLEPIVNFVTNFTNRFGIPESTIWGFVGGKLASMGGSFLAKIILKASPEEIAKGVEARQIALANQTKFFEEAKKANINPSIGDPKQLELLDVSGDPDDATLELFARLDPKLITAANLRKAAEELKGIPVGSTDRSTEMLSLDLASLTQLDAAVKQRDILRAEEQRMIAKQEADEKRAAEEKEQEKLKTGLRKTYGIGKSVQIAKAADVDPTYTKDQITLPSFDVKKGTPSSQLLALVKEKKIPASVSKFTITETNNQDPVVTRSRDGVEVTLPAKPTSAELAGFLALANSIQKAPRNVEKITLGKGMREDRAQAKMKNGSLELNMIALAQFTQGTGIPQDVSKMSNGTELAMLDGNWKDVTPKQDNSANKSTNPPSTQIS